MYAVWLELDEMIGYNCAYLYIVEQCHIDTDKLRVSAVNGSAIHGTNTMNCGPIYRRESQLISVNMTLFMNQDKLSNCRRDNQNDRHVKIDSKVVAAKLYTSMLSSL